MKSGKLGVVVLAAGQGTRMRSAMPKVLHEVAGRPMLTHVLMVAESLSPERIVVVVGPDMPQVEAAAGTHAVVVQERQLGTGDAVAAASQALSDIAAEGGDILVLFGDTPLLREETLAALCDRRAREPEASIVALAFRKSPPHAYGRIKLEPGGAIAAIVEASDASPEEQQIDLCNAGVLIAEGRVLLDLVGRLSSDNAQSEYYLTDIFALARGQGLKAAVQETLEAEVVGVNSRAELAVAERLMQERLRHDAMMAGVTFVDPDTVHLAMDTRLGRDVVIEPHVVFAEGVEIGDGVRINAFSHLAGAKVDAGAQVGPYARLRPGARVGPRARVGNFVEVKNASLGAGAKANHLTYLGDADVGEDANVGAGTITCNYDGFNKHRTVIGAGAFIGSNTALVAPVNIGSGAVVGAGSTLTEDVEDDAVALSRAPQTNRSGAAVRLRERLSKLKQTLKG
ncbi:MAG: bifunctional UDP-N-acetylglucosamine diphosphorylase/glucosamine-1-phosphate N-acetyltransferase GlmU [Rhodovibrionaceae bacterium]|nr:bifunctional UDP-N-acetylglucosamine diphosphorylase/glucosamine-1-phosphate N-acetyltransferase GlmU [Rhodovibrionaceae bacterium]